MAETKSSGAVLGAGTSRGPGAALSPSCSEGACVSQGQHAECQPEEGTPWVGAGRAQTWHCCCLVELLRRPCWGLCRSLGHTAMLWRLQSTEASSRSLAGGWINPLGEGLP